MRNRYYIVRHGYSLRNEKKIADCWPEKIRYPLTEKGKKQIEKAAGRLENKKIDLIFHSDMLRTRQSAEIIGRRLGLEIKADKRLREVNVGVLNGRPIGEIGKFWNKKQIPLEEYYSKRFRTAPPEGETYRDIEKRLASFIKDTEKKYKGKNILIVGHQRPLTLLEKIVNKFSFKEFVETVFKRKEIKTGEVRKLSLK
jgi:isoleucyl-tRNA synthetase